MPTSRWPVAKSDADFARYLADMPSSTRDMFRAFLAMARSCGDVIFELQDEPIVLRGSHRIYGSVRPGNDGLSGHLVLDREVDDSRIDKVDPLTKRLYFHRWRIFAVESLDDRFRDLLCAAHAIGNGEHLSRS